MSRSPRLSLSGGTSSIPFTDPSATGESVNLDRARILD
jgi:hypothetical protein